MWFNKQICFICEKEIKQSEPRTPGDSWTLNNYFGLTGTCCRKCYDLISHDCHKKPNNPKAYDAILLKHKLKK